MRFAVFGTGMVGRALAGKLSSLGHEVSVGTRDPAATLARSERDSMGNPPFSAWHSEHPRVKLATFRDAAQTSAFIVNATNGQASLDALRAAGDLGDKTIIDISNPLDFSKGMPPTLAVCNDDSLAERIQAAFPDAKVVKTLNTVNAHLMVEPAQLAGAEHSVFVSGNDVEAKQQVTDLLASFGWKDVIDLGDITSARGTEMWLPLWLRLLQTNQSPMFNLKVVR